MKKLFCLIFVFFGLTIFHISAEKINDKADVSYAFGMLVAEDLMAYGVEFDYDAFILGFRTAMEGKESRFTVMEAIERVNIAFMAARARMMERNLVEGLAFLAENSTRPNVVVTPSGLQFEHISEGTGEKPGPADWVLVHYHGTTINGNVFDTTRDTGEPVEIPLFRVIPGWSEGLRMMKEGGKARFVIPPDLAYGEQGVGTIEPNSVLIFDVELLSITRR